MTVQTFGVLSDSGWLAYGHVNLTRLSLTALPMVLDAEAEDVGFDSLEVSRMA